MRLSDIEGQDDAVRALRTSLHRNEIAHAYLFAGPANTGKMTAAIAIAAALNCANQNPEGDACGSCPSCRRIAAGTSSDVLVVSPEGNQTKIDQMRDMVKSLNYAPLGGRWSVVIVEQADTLNPYSENSILKILEEPPPYAVLILLSCNPTALLPTIRSRCRIIRFTRAGPGRIEEMLRRRFDLSGEEVKLISECAQGAMGRAIRMAGDPAVLEQRGAVLEILRNWPASPSVYALKAAETIRKMAEGKDADERTRIQKLQGFLDYMLSWYADLLELNVRGSDASVCNVDLLDDLQGQAGLYSKKRLQSGIRSIMETRRYLEGNITAQLALENMLFDLRPASP